MSKAFTADDAAEAPLVVLARAPLPAGVPNYVTPRGVAALRSERHELQAEWARLLSSVTGDPDRPRAIATLTARLEDLEDRLSSAIVVAPPKEPQSDIRFGAKVTVRSEAGTDRRFEIVGVDEADASRDRVAFVAPLARAVLGKRVGDVAVVRTPRSTDEVEIVSVEYGAKGC